MDIKREAWTTQLRCAYLLTLMRTSSYGQTKKHITCVKGLVQLSYMWEFADTCWSFTCTHKTQLVGTLGSKAEGLALMMFLFASFTKETASRVLQQLVHRQLSQKTPADQQHIQANIAIPDVCITAVSHTGDAIRRIWWLNVQMHSPVTVQRSHSCTCFSFFAFSLAQPASQHA